jgi:hypothetical protein
MVQNAMQSLDFARGLQEITIELKAQELLNILQTWITPAAANVIPQEQKQKFTTLLFNAHSGFDQLMTQPTTRKVLEELSLSEFWEPGRLEGMVSRVSGLAQPQQIWNSPDLFRQFYTFTESLRWLMKTESAAVRLLAEEKKGQVAESDGIVELELMEYDDEDGIPAERFRAAVETIMELHLCLAYIHGLRNDRLRFRYVDSGSKFTVGVECAKAVAETMGMLLALFWDKFRFWGHDSFNKNLDTASKSLAFAALVDQQVEKNVITPEEGSNLKSRTFTALEELTGLGVSLPLTDELTIDRRKLLAEKRDTKLLGTGAHDENEDVPLPELEPPAEKPGS